MFIPLSDHPQDYSSSIPNSTAPFRIQLIMEAIVVIIVALIDQRTLYVENIPGQMQKANLNYNPSNIFARSRLV